MKNLAQPLTAESTQTVRALTRAELDGSSHAKWYVVQLAMSDQPINLEMMPRLPIMAEHRLYAVVGTQDGRQRHALRLGFFAEESLARMMCQHVQTFFAASTVVRVSVAEQERFADSSASKRQSTAKPASSRDRPIAASIAAVTPSRQSNARSPAAAHAASAGNDGAFLPPEIAMKTGAFRAMTPQPRSANGTKPLNRSSPSTPARTGIKKTKSLGEELMEEARQVQLSKSGKHRVVEPPQTWLSRLLGRRKR